MIKENTSLQTEQWTSAEQAIIEDSGWCLPGVLLDQLNLPLFPFYVYEEIESDVSQVVNIVGEENNSRTHSSPSGTSESFGVTIKFSTKEERFFMLTWFIETVQGKLNLFYFPTNVPNIKIIEFGENFVKVQKDYISQANIKGKIYIPELSFVSSYRYNVLKSTIDYDYLELTSATLPLQNDYSCDIELLRVCRLDTDTLSFDLEDVNISSVKFRLKTVEVNDVSVVKNPPILVRS